MIDPGDKAEEPEFAGIPWGSTDFEWGSARSPAQVCGFDEAEENDEK